MIGHLYNMIEILRKCNDLWMVRNPSAIGRLIGEYIERLSAWFDFTSDYKLRDPKVAEMMGWKRQLIYRMGHFLCQGG